MSGVIIIVYTTLYRKGGEQFPIVANTIAREKAEVGTAHEIIARAVESKREVLAIFDEVATAGKTIKEFHFVGHSGMYGPMFGTVAFPEQFSPYEWETMRIPFDSDAAAYFHCCRSARWFAPYFSRTFNVPAYGFFWYTTFSKSKTHYRYASPAADVEKLFTIGCKGRKSHGLAASLVKFSGLMPAETMRRFEPQPPTGDTSYNQVAELYDATFTDITVRQDEWAWLNKHLPESRDLKVLDIGCGNGALLNALASRISYGAGVDESEAILEKARRRNSAHQHLEFKHVDSPALPFVTATFDVAISLMSFRYLDWDPLLHEIRRVLKPDGKFLIVDMVTVPVKIKEYPQLIKDKLRTINAQKKNSEFDANLKKLVAHPDWKKMVEYNPIRSEHEMKWYLESRFPGQKMEVLNLGWNARIVAFDSGPVRHGLEVKLTYP
ncbi:MAG TPA: class I SAM-dependent methyltransferase [Pyrinomonadaceae bacterium]|nr:class I SAM-dependent methyltransferase [Pyrinomonadaceae bacterium]